MVSNTLPWRVVIRCAPALHHALTLWMAWIYLAKTNARCQSQTMSTISLLDQCAKLVCEGVSKSIPCRLLYGTSTVKCNWSKLGPFFPLGQTQIPAMKSKALNVLTGDPKTSCTSSSYLYEINEANCWCTGTGSSRHHSGM